MTLSESIARFQLHVLTICFALGAASVHGQVDLEEALSSFEIHPDFQIELIAAEPVIFDPVDLAFDEHGRAFVVEMPGYPFPDVPGRVILLEDSDGDGYYESRKVFAEGFAVAASILPYEGGLLVASPPDLVFVKDTDGDGVADLRETVLSGFRVDNPQHNFSGLNHGLDNWIYGANGGNSGSPYFLANPDDKTPLRGNDFRFDLRTERFERIGRSTGGFELTLDAWGRVFGTHNLRPISHLVFPSRYLEGLPAPRSGTLAPIPDDEENGLVRIYPLGPQDTRVNHPEQSGYFSGSCGITYYGGGAFPEGFNGNVFIMDVVLNLVHRRVLSPNGATFTASRGRDRVEFLASTDRGFRPVNMTVAPDGSLWLLDMHRTVIEHPEWIPDELEEKMDLDEGKQQGRIYRITPKGGLPSAKPNFDRARIQDAVAALGHPNQWWRQTAQRLLVEWNDKEAIDPLTDLLESSSNPLARLHALWTLEGLGALEPERVLRALSDPHAGVRENALIIAEELLSDHTEIQGAVLALANDADPRVRMQTALALNLIPLQAAAPLLAIFEQDAKDPWTRLALYPKFSKNPQESTSALTLYEPIDREARADIINMLARLVGERHSNENIEVFIQNLLTLTIVEPTIAPRALESFVDGVRARSSQTPRIELSRNISSSIGTMLENENLDVVRGAWQLARELGLPQDSKKRRRLRDARSLLKDTNRLLSERLDNLKLYEFADFDDRVDLLFDLLDSHHPAELQIEAIEQLEREQNHDVAKRLIDMWRELGPNTRVQAGDLLLYHRGNHDLLLTALEDRRISLGELNLHLERRRVLLHSRQPGIRERAEALFTDAGVVTRREALERMRPALDLAGNPALGKEVFTELCVKCHRMGLEGGDLGPNLGEIFRKSGETLLHDILDPNAGVNSEFVSFTIDLPDGEVVSGILVQETELDVTIRDATGKQTTVRRDEMIGMYSDGLSLMPEELEVGMELQEMADLLAYLQEPK